jgi:hypothetical protein
MAPGPKGRDSALFWGAAGEHVLTASDVDAMGGHGAVHAFRNALHRQDGGEIPHYDNGGAVGQDWLNQQLQARGLSPSEARGILAMNQVEGGAANPMSLLGFTESQAQGPQGHVQAFMGQWNDPSRRGPGGAIPGVGAGGSVSDWNQYMTWIRERIVGQTGAASDWQGNAQPPAAVYQNSLMNALRGDTGGGDVSGAGAPSGYYGPQQVHAQETVTHLQNQIKTLEEKRDELKADASRSERDRLNEEIRHDHELLDEANGRLAKAQQGGVDGVSAGGRGGGSGRGGGVRFMDGPGGFGAPLPANFGLGKGLAGLAEWVVTFLGDMAVAPIEARMAAQAQMSGSDESMTAGAYSPAIGGGSAGGFANVGSAFGSTSFTPPVSGGGFGAQTAATVSPRPAPSNARPSAPMASGWGWGPGASAPGGGSQFAGMDPGFQQFADSYLAAHGGQLPPEDPMAKMSPGFQSFAQDYLQSHGGQIPELPAYTPPGNVPGIIKKPPFEQNLPPVHFGVPQPHFSGGTSDVGPSGSDTVPAWLTPGEAVLTVDQARAWRNAGHFAPGNPNVQDTGASAPAPKPPPAPKPTTPGGPQGEGVNKEMINKQPSPTGGGVGSQSTPSKGLGISGGAIGAAEGAAGSAAGMFGGGGGGAAMQVATQLMNRTVAFGGQMVGIAAQGILSSVLPTDSPLSDFGNTLPGKLLTGISGAKPAAPQSAGNTKPPLKPQGGSGAQPQGPAPGGMTINGMTVQANSADQFRDTMERQQRQYQMDANQYSGRK